MKICYRCNRKVIVFGKNESLVILNTFKCLKGVNEKLKACKHTHCISQRSYVLSINQLNTEHYGFVLIFSKNHHLLTDLDGRLWNLLLCSQTTRYFDD